jgi:signal transduction histidine kinase
MMSGPVQSNHRGSDAPGALAGRLGGELRQELELRRMMVAQTDAVLRTLGHELGNVVNGMRTTLSVLRSKLESPSPQTATCLDLCFESLESAQQMLVAVKTYHAAKVSLQPLDLRDHLGRETDLIFKIARTAGAHCRFSCTPRALPVLADPTAMLQVLINLVDNAAAAAHRCSDPEIELSCEQLERIALVQVRDNGHGIAEDDLVRVFAPFYTTWENRSGIGLTLVQKLMVKMGALITIDSRKDSGTTVKLYFPLTGSTTGAGASEMQ